MTARNPNKLPTSTQNARNSRNSPWRRQAACNTHKAQQSRQRLDEIDNAAPMTSDFDPNKVPF